jgi:ferritin-like metal-binding protein YciE
MYDAEQQFLNGMIEMEVEARDEALGTMLREHIVQTEQHIKTLDRVFEILREVRVDLRNEVAAALATSAQMALQRAGTDWLRDLAVLSSASKNEHYEIASYRSLIASARAHGQEKVAELLRANLQDEEHAATRLEEDELRLVYHAITEEQKPQAKKAGQGGS